jgi:hypothetical protein
MSLPTRYDRPASSVDANPKLSPVAPAPTRFGLDPKSLLALEIGDEDLLEQCHFAPFCATPHAIADGECSYPFCDGVLTRFWDWRSGMKTFSKAANQCHFVPFTENDS